MAAEKKRILIADPCEKFLNEILSCKEALNYHFEKATDGSECLAKISSFKPDLVILDMMLPYYHGIEILRRMKFDPLLKTVGVIITCSYPMLQSYRAATSLGANYFLCKPFECSRLLELLNQFFSKGLSPDPFPKSPLITEKTEKYIPKTESPHAYLKFWGTRGSNPVSGPEYVRFGGNTCSLEVRDGDDLIIIDAGTGIRPLGHSIPHSRKGTFNVFLSHTHWDHLLGFPFFWPIYDPDCHVNIWTPIGFEKSPKELFTEMLAYSFFPVRLDEIQAQLSFHEILPGKVIEIGKFRIESQYAFHPGSTVCFKIHVRDKKVIYATDNEIFMGYLGRPGDLKLDNPIMPMYQSMIDFFKDSDLIIHEAQYTPMEYQNRIGWGHTSITNGIALMKLCNAKEWIMTHHDPSHTDVDIIQKIQLQYDIAKEVNLQCTIRMAYDGIFVPI